MTQFELAEDEPSATVDCNDLDQRDMRALTEYMTTLPLGGDVYSVTTESGSEYRVDAREGRCTCPDFEFRDSVEECKHIRRVRIEVGQVDIKKLESELVETADNLESNAVDLEDQARELANTADELRDALNRLEEVAQ